MRKKLPKYGDKRIREGFLWFPLEINYEQRWWEDAKWEEIYEKDYEGGYYWKPTKWLD